MEMCTEIREESQITRNTAVYSCTCSCIHACIRCIHAIHSACIDIECIHADHASDSTDSTERWLALTTLATWAQPTSSYDLPWLLGQSHRYLVVWLQAVTSSQVLCCMCDFKKFSFGLTSKSTVHIAVSVKLCTVYTALRYSCQPGTLTES